MSSVLQGAYNTTASVGTAFSYASLVGGIVFSIVIFIVGFVFLFAKPIPSDDSSKKNPMNNYIGGGALIFGFIILIFSILSFYLIKKSKPLAAIAGTENIVNVVEGAFKKPNNSFGKNNTPISV